MLSRLVVNILQGAQLLTLCHSKQHGFEEDQEDDQKCCECVYKHQ